MHKPKIGKIRISTECSYYKTHLTYCKGDETFKKVSKYDHSHQRQAEFMCYLK